MYSWGNFVFYYHLESINFRLLLYLYQVFTSTRAIQNNVQFSKLELDSFIVKKTYLRTIFSVRSFKLWVLSNCCEVGRFLWGRERVNKWNKVKFSSRCYVFLPIQTRFIAARSAERRQEKDRSHLKAELRSSVDNWRASWRLHDLKSKTFKPGNRDTLLTTGK